MLTSRRLHDPLYIETKLRRDSLLHLYELGDLDDFYWPHTEWFGPTDGGEEVALLYKGGELPVLLAMEKAATDRMRSLLESLDARLPRRLYAHLTGDLVAAFRRTRRIEDHGGHLRMALTDRARLEGMGGGSAAPLTGSDLADLQTLYAESYPGNWFDPRMLETGRYFGIRKHGIIASVAGVHVFSRRLRVAALGNITTHPRYRGQGLGTAVTAALTRSLLPEAAEIGLNVKADNATAIRCYERLGFTTIARYGEYMLTVLP